MQEDLNWYAHYIEILQNTTKVENYLQLVNVISFVHSFIYLFI